MPIIVQNCLIFLALAGQIAQSGGIFRVHQMECPNLPTAIHIHTIWEYTDSLFGFFSEEHHKDGCCSHSHQSAPVDKHAGANQGASVLSWLPAESSPCCFEHSRTVSPEYVQSVFLSEELSDNIDIIPLNSFLFTDNPAFCHRDLAQSSKTFSSFPPQYVVLQTLLI